MEYHYHQVTDQYDSRIREIEIAFSALDIPDQLVLEFLFPLLEDALYYQYRQLQSLHYITQRLLNIFPFAEYANTDEELYAQYNRLCGIVQHLSRLFANTESNRFAQGRRGLAEIETSDEEDGDGVRTAEEDNIRGNVESRFDDDLSSEWSVDDSGATSEGSFEFISFPPS